MISGRLLEHAVSEAGKMGFAQAYRCTDRDGYYEKFGWRFLGNAWLANGEEVKVYVKQASRKYYNEEKSG